MYGENSAPLCSFSFYITDPLDILDFYLYIYPVTSNYFNLFYIFNIITVFLLSQKYSVCGFYQYNETINVRH